jgi:hypothetical protein
MGQKDFFVYENDISALAAAASVTSNLQILADADFFLVKMAFFADIAGAVETDSTRVIPLVTIQVTDTGSGRQLFSGAVPIPSIFGTGQIPFILPIVRKFAANSTIQLAYTNFSAATTYNIRTSFIGWKEYA